MLFRSTISANSDEAVGNLIADAMEKVGKDGVITVEEAKGIVDELNVVEGMQFDRGYLSPYFVTNPDKMEAVIENPYILLYEKKARCFLQNNYKILTSRPKSVFRRVCCIFHKPPCISARNRLCLKQRNRSLSLCSAFSIVFAFLMVAARFLFSAKEEQIL